MSHYVHNYTDYIIIIHVHKRLALLRRHAKPGKGLIVKIITLIVVCVAKEMIQSIGYRSCTKPAKGLQAVAI